MMLEIDAVAKVFGSAEHRVEALVPTSLAVAEHEFVSFLGPSGCGKSTLLNMIAGLDNPSSGQILLDGQPVLEPSYDVGMVFQSYTLFPWLNVRENAAFAAGLKCNGAKGQLYDDRPRNLYERADRFLELVGLADFKKAYPSTLSGGMKQRLAIARALTNRPKVLLMDEPFSALDSQTREDMQDMIRLLSRLEGITVIFVTHDVEEAVYLSDRIFSFSPRPGRLTSVTTVPFGLIRSPELKLDTAFLNVKRKLLSQFADAAEPGFDRARLLALVEGKNIK